jgi:hypothetical protein
MLDCYATIGAVFFAGISGECQGPFGLPSLVAFLIRGKSLHRCSQSLAPDRRSGFWVLFRHARQLFPVLAHWPFLCRREAFNRKDEDFITLHPQIPVKHRAERDPSPAGYCGYQSNLSEV